MNTNKGLQNFKFRTRWGRTTETSTSPGPTRMKTAHGPSGIRPPHCKRTHQKRRRVGGGATVHLSRLPRRWLGYITLRAVEPGVSPGLVSRVALINCALCGCPPLTHHRWGPRALDTLFLSFISPCFSWCFA